ncbi:ATP-binding protein [Microbacterium sp. LWH13-1.2]|uniref:AlbA family DNA-binding domain-containing protein n=1 Tax=Microbacterium sp. LWH13-1.2 TaxID=3135260 RepID=UPI003138FCC5
MWPPRTEQDLTLALDTGDLRENAGLDFKRETGSSDGARAETARDLASFAIDGGALLIGVEEKGGGLTLTPFPLAGAAEKLEQIAANRVDPPLPIRVTDIPSDDDPSVGFLYVEVPPSPFAPHMVLGRYPARGDRTKRVLTDAEVVRLHQTRREPLDRVQELLTAWSSRVVVSENRRLEGHVHLIAEPLTQLHRQVFESVSRAPNPGPALNIIKGVEEALPSALRTPRMTLHTPNDWNRRADGSAWTNLTPGRPELVDGTEERDIVDLEFHDTGGFRIMLGRAIDFLSSGGGHVAVVNDDGIVAYCWRAMLLAQQISVATGYRGLWGFGVHADGLQDKFSQRIAHTRYHGESSPYERLDYSMTTTAHLFEIEQNPWAVVDRLVGRLLHSLGSRAAFVQALGVEENQTTTL